VSRLSDPFNPAVLNLIAGVIRAGHEQGKTVGMCGEMAADPLATPLLVGMGLDEFSLSASAIPRLKATIRTLDSARCQELWQKARELGEGRQISRLLEEQAKKQ
jgi:phosphotransferase system enzyme I (PtsI)